MTARTLFLLSLLYCLAIAAPICSVVLAGGAAAPPIGSKTIYRVVVAQEAMENPFNLAAFEQQVQQYLDSGWSLHGSTLTTRRGLIQAVTKVVDIGAVEPEVKIVAPPEPPKPEKP